MRTQLVRRFRSLSRRKKLAVGVSLSACSLVAFAGAAYAYFANTASTSFAVGGTAWTVTIGTVSGGPLTPGSGTVSIPVSVTNSSQVTEDLTSLTATLKSDANGDVWDTSANGGTGGWAVGCLASWFQLTFGGLSASGVAPNQTVSPEAPLTITMPADPNDNQNACVQTMPEVDFSAS